MSVTILHGDCRAVLPTLADCSVQCCVTSPPYYGLRDYGVDGQIGLEPTPDEYVAEMVAVFREVRRVLRDDGVLWLNIGDSYNAHPGQRKATDAAGAKQQSNNGSVGAPSRSVEGLKPKDLLGIPWLLAFALRADGWYLRSDIIWAKSNPMPESVRDRPTSAHEHVFLLSKRAAYFYDADAIVEEGVIPAGTKGAKGSAERAAMPGVNSRPPEYKVYDGKRSARNVWTIATQPFSGTTKTVRQVRVAWDAPDDGKKRIASPDCPIHGDRAGRAAMASCGGHADDPASRNGNTATRHAQAQPSGSAPIGQLFEQATAACNSGSPRLACSPSASSHSNQTSRMDPVLGTNSACKPSAQKHSDTERTSEAPASSVPCDCTPASNTASDEMACNASHQTMFGTGDNQPEQATSSASDPRICTCEYYIERTEKTSHFATMPPELAERCIKAGTSEKGACPHCGAPWERVVDRLDATAGGKARATADVYTGAAFRSPQSAPRGTKSNFGQPESITTGWSPSCACPAHQPVPCTVLDPFGGAGTTGLVADRLGRSATLIELNQQYRALAAERITDDAPLFAGVA